MSDVIAILILCVVTFFLVIYGPCLVNVCEGTTPISSTDSNGAV